MSGEDGDRFVAVSDELTLRYRVAGHGETAIVFVPGWTMTCEVFEYQFSHFADSGDYTAISYDPRSQGLSTQTPGGHHYEQHARDLHGLLAALGYRRCVLVGWSAGGIAVLEYLRLYGHADVAGAVIIDVPPKMRGHDRRVEWVDFGTIDNGDQDDELKAVCYDLQFDRRAFNQRFCSSLLDDPDPVLVNRLCEMSSCTTDLVAVQLMISLWFVDDTSVARELDAAIPMMYYVREDMGPLATQWAHRHAPHAIVRAHGQHAMFWEYPAVFNDALDEFLTSLAPSTRT